MDLSQLLVLIVVFYLVGSFPSGYVLVKVFNNTDIRSHGSKSTGATNVLRVGGKVISAATLVLDILKIIIPLWLLSIVFNPMRDVPADALVCYSIILGASGVIGHMYSPMLRFDGGKGIAAMLGLVLWVEPAAGVLAFFVFMVIVFSTKMVSLGSLVGVAIASLWIGIYTLPALFLEQTLSKELLYSAICIFYTAVALIVWRHRSNMIRILHGQENKLNKM